MALRIDPNDPKLRHEFHARYRDFFDRAERRRRWSLTDDIPWDQVNPNMDPAIADIVESFCAVELFLPDYIGKVLPLVRENKGWSNFHANWGYEESKHSLALGDWLLRSGLRSDEQMADFESSVFEHEWNVPHESPAGTLIYGMAQELATALHYRNLRYRVDEIGDPCLSKLLNLITVDERSHHAFYMRMVHFFLELDREGTIEQLKRVLSSFSMPAVHMLAETHRRQEQIRSLDIFNESVYVEEVYYPILKGLELTPRDLRKPRNK